MVSPTKRWLVATATAALAGVAGCSTPTAGSAPAAGADTADAAVGSSDGSGACGSESGFCITVDITGAATVQGTAEALNLGTCADFAKGEAPGGDLQLPGLLGEEIGGQKVSAFNEIRGYSGPGTYEKDVIRSVGGVIDVSIDTTPYQLADETTAQAVINEDGSGSFTFANLKEGEQGNPTTPKGMISGSYSWTCTD
jgi:hypothetical protein